MQKALRQHRTILLLSLLLAADVEAATRINSGTAQWAMAAKTGRADMLILGDSIVSYGQGGWAAGVAHAAQNSIGLAGSGLLASPYEYPYVWASYSGARIWSGPAEDSKSAGIASLSPSGRHYSVPGGLSFVGTGSDPIGLDLDARLDWHVFAAGTTPAAQLQATRTRRTDSPWSASVIQTSPVQSIEHSTTSLAEYVFEFDETANPGDWNSFAFTNASRDTAVYYNKLIHPDATGITVSGWSFSGGATEGFRNDYYNHARFTAEGRSAMYDALVSGNSGKLNVAITFGVNDANQVTPAAYGNSIRGLISDVRRDWQNAGMDLHDLSFSLVSAYQVNLNGYPAASFQRLSDFRAQLDAIAAGDEQISFIDIWETGPTWQQAIANNYLADYVHPTMTGTQVYGDLMLQQLIPIGGDTDFDDDVDFDDLLALARHYGQSSDVNWNDGDFDGVNGVSFEDLLVMSQNYGTNAVANADSFAADWLLAQSIVPEPSSMLGVAALGLFARRRR